MKEQTIIHSVQLWEKITGRRAPYTVKHVDRSHKIVEKEGQWLTQMERTIENWGPEAHGYVRYRAKNIGFFFEKRSEKR
jgi:hypothetical protein